MKVGNTIVTFLKAGNGDSILIDTIDENNESYKVLVDGGTAQAYSLGLKKRLKEVEKIDLLVLTHIDSDHIAGIIKLLKSRLGVDLTINKYWVNCPNLIKVMSSDKISYNQGIALEEILLSKEKCNKKFSEEIFYTGSSLKLANGISITVLSPTADILTKLNKNWPAINTVRQSGVEVKISNTTISQIPKGEMPDLAKKVFSPSKSIDYDIVNASSIAFILCTKGCKILMLGDSRPEIILESLNKLGYCANNKLKVDLVKVSHHGSLNNTSCELLDIIECDCFVISTNGGTSTHKHPDRETISRIIYHGERDFTKQRTIYFNYPIKDIEKRAGSIFNEEDLKKGNWVVKELNYA